MDEEQIRDLVKQLIGEDGFDRLVNLAAFCEDFFNDPDGAWGMRAGKDLRTLTGTTEGEIPEDVED
jgi:hypothetical protein